MHEELGHSQRPAWTPRLSRAFVNALRATLNEDGSRRWSDPTIRHAMGKRIMQKTGNVAAVQRQLGHKNASYALQYARPSFSEMEAAINEE